MGEAVRVADLEGVRVLCVGSGRLALALVAARGAPNRSPRGALAEGGAQRLGVSARGTALDRGAVLGRDHWRDSFTAGRGDPLRHWAVSGIGSRSVASAPSAGSAGSDAASSLAGPSRIANARELAALDTAGESDSAAAVEDNTGDDSTGRSAPLPRVDVTKPGTRA